MGHGPTDCASAAAPIDQDEMSVETTCQNGSDLVREAVGCKRVLGRCFVNFVDRRRFTLPRADKPFDLKAL